MPLPGPSEIEGSEKTAETSEDTATHERLSKLVETAQEKRVRTIRALWAELQKSREENLELRERLSRSEARALSSQASSKFASAAAVALETALGTLREGLEPRRATGASNLT